MDFVNEQWSRAPQWAKLTTAIALPAASAGYILGTFINDYRGWLALGPGGLPYGLSGYLMNLLMTGIIARNDTTSLWMYGRPERYAVGWKQASEDEKAQTQKAFINGSLPHRLGPRSKAKHHCAPQREKNIGEYMDPELKRAYFAAIDKLAEENSDCLEWKTSVLEKRGKALFLKPNQTVPTLIAKCQGEVAHLHDSDMSGHLLLSFADAKEVLAKGWGERHRMTGSARIPLGYTMLYVPRNVEELETFVKIFEAGIEYAKSSG